MAEHRVDLLAWCLMTNHVHLVLVPKTADGLEGAVGRTHWRYSQTINRLHHRSGHLWQGRFLSCPLDESHLLSAMRYVERNPVRARMVRLAERYPWSSAAAHCGENSEELRHLINANRWAERYSPKAWQALLRRADDERAK